MKTLHTLPAQARWYLIGLALCGTVGCGSEKKPQPVPDGAQVLLTDGDRLLPNFEILSIESANMAADRSISFIASRTGTDSLNGVFFRTPTGQIRSILSPGSALAGDLPLTRIRKLNMAQSGQFAFSVGDQLDDNAIFYSDGTRTSLIATTESDLPRSKLVLWLDAPTGRYWDFRLHAGRQQQTKRVMKGIARAVPPNLSHFRHAC